MKCPVCKDVTLLMSEKKGIEIDYCPECRGIWLDRGELEKLIEKETTYNDNYYQESRKPREPERDYGKDYENNYKKDEYYYDKQNPKYRKRRKESFLGEIFDIFGD